ncbi:MAG: DNA replication/repair protein RecF [Clostridia bacterium]
MYIESVFLKNFRNYKEKFLTFDKGLNVIVGNNATGKTNLLESIYLCALGKSPRTTKEKEMILWGQLYTYVKIVLVKKFRKHNIEIQIDDKGKKKIIIDGISILKLGEIIGVLNIIFFSPDEMKMIKESPQERRRFIDISLSQQKKSYLYDVLKYNKILAQRNKLLKTAKSQKAILETLPIWDIQLAKVGANIVSERYKFIAKLNTYASVKHALLTEGKEAIKLEYKSQVNDTNVLDMEKTMLQLYKDSAQKDVELCYTTVGVHRDDMEILVNDMQVRKFGSQGQQRTSTLSLKLAEIEMFEMETKEKPIILLDDVLSELDDCRQQKLLEATKDNQTFLTCTSFDLKAQYHQVEYNSQ